MKKVEKIQYQAALAITGAWQGSSRSKIYDELGWETQSDRRNCRRVLQIHKIINNNTISYLKDKLPANCKEMFSGIIRTTLHAIICKQIDTRIVSSLMQLLLGIFLWKYSILKLYHL